MRKKNRKAALAVLLAAGIAAAGCGTNPSDGGSAKQEGQAQADEKTEQGTGAGGSETAGQNEKTDAGGSETAGRNEKTDAGGGGSADENEETLPGTEADGSNADTQDGGAEEKTEIRREDYPDCDGSGHGYVEIYYSDGSMETEEY